MNITFENNKFHLYNENVSYVLAVSEKNELINLHYGSRIDSEDLSECVEIRDFELYIKDSKYYPSVVHKEYPQALGDFRSPAVEAELSDGRTDLKLEYVSYEITDQKPALSGLPSVYTHSDSESKTLKVVLSDKLQGVEVYMYYTIFRDFDAVCRHTEIVNISERDIYLTNAQSMSIDFNPGEYEYIHLGGAWTREKHVDRCSVHKGTQGFESRRGASGHNENPFMAFFEKGAGESFGSVYGFSFVYSGNHRFLIEKEAQESVRVQVGINPFGFKYKLCGGESFVTPEVVMVYSNSGFEKMSRTYHSLYRTRLCRGTYRDRVRPVLINNWEATYFDFNRQSLLDIADSASKLGVELFVLDDGWFGKRDNDDCSLGDWYVNEQKLGGDLHSFAEEINRRGLKFGLWFEPEMISPDSDLYRSHPDWAIHVPEREPHITRNQLVLDYTRSDVREYIVKTISDVLGSANIEYVKWDMNRNITDVYSEHLGSDRQGEFYHRYILGLYEVMEKITSAFPYILFESCSGGGGRNDPGMLYYMPQNWASDDTDAVERLYIQYGGSFVYPSSSVGSHVSAVPNHQSGRITSLSMRGTVAMTGAFGYELDLSKMTDEEKEEVKAQIELYKKIRPVIAFGDYYRLTNPHEGRAAAWMYVSEDKSKAVFAFAVTGGKPNAPGVSVRLKGLDEDARYSLDGKVYSGRTLMNHGIYFDCRTENTNYTYVLERI